MDKRKDEINNFLRQLQKHLFASVRLGDPMVYLVAGNKQNRMLLEHIKSQGITAVLTHDLETEQFLEI